MTRTTDYRSMVVLVLSLVFSAVPAYGEAPETPEQKAQRMRWWTDARFGMFIHWGPVSLKGTEIGWSRGNPVPVAEYDALYKQFNPVKFDAKEYVSLAKEAGMKYITLVSKHHDGFCMFDSKYTDYTIMHGPFKRDIAGELAAECKRQGLRFCTYYSIIDWYQKDYLPRGAGDKRPVEGADYDRYYAYMKNQLAELISRYGPLGMMWFDGEWEKTWTVARGREIYAMLRRIQPDIIINNRLSKGRPMSGFAPAESTVGDFATPEQTVGLFDLQRRTYWESNMTICQQWAWKPNDKFKSLQECIHLLVRNAGMDGNFMLNISPMPSGEIEPRQVNRLKEIGRWMAAYGESIYGTRGGPYMPANWGVSTCKGNVIYLHILKGTPGETIMLSPIEKKVVSSTVLTGGTVEVKQDGKGLSVRVPAQNRQEIDAVVALTLDGAAMDITPRPARAGQSVGSGT
jgi:alpha-L-fucosidase